MRVYLMADRGNGIKMQRGNGLAVNLRARMGILDDLVSQLQHWRRPWWLVESRSAALARKCIEAYRNGAKCPMCARHDGTHAPSCEMDGATPVLGRILASGGGK